MVKFLLPLVLALLPVFDVQTQAQVFPNAFWNRTSSCSGSLTSGRLVSRIRTQRAARIEARTQTASCGGLASYPQQTASCSGSLSAYVPQTTSGCAGVTSYQTSYQPASQTVYQASYQAVPQVVYQAAPQSYDVYYPQPQTQPLPQQAAPKVICDGNTCTIISSVVPVAPPQFAPTKSFVTPKPKSVSLTESMFGLSVSNESTSIPNHVLAQIATDETFGLSTTIPDHVLGQVDTQPTKVAENFKPSLLKAIVEGRKAGKISVRDAVKLRVACLSPAFVERAHELAVTQMAFNGEASTAVPMDDEGMIQTEGINWEGLAKFLEAFIPLLITLLKAFGL